MRAWMIVGAVVATGCGGSSTPPVEEDPAMQITTELVEGLEVSRCEFRLPDGTRTHAYVAGTEGPVIIALHGSGPYGPREIVDPSITWSYQRQFALKLAGMGYVVVCPNGWPIPFDDRYRQRYIDYQTVDILSERFGLDSSAMISVGISWGAHRAIDMATSFHGPCYAAGFQWWATPDTPAALKQNHHLVRQIDRLMLAYGTPPEEYVEGSPEYAEAVGAEYYQHEGGHEIDLDHLVRWVVNLD